MIATTTTATTGSTIAPTPRVEKNFGDTVMSATTASTIPAPAVPLSLGWNFAWTTAGTVAQAAGQWLPLVIMARRGSAGMVGDYALALAVSSPVLLLFQMQLRAVQATDCVQEFSFSTYFLLRLVTSAVAASLLLLFGFAFLPSVTAAVVMLAAFGRIGEGFSEIVYGELQRQERMNRIAYSQILRAVAGSCVTFVLVRYGYGVVLTAAAIALSSCCVTALDYLSRKRRDAVLHWNPVRLINLVRLVAPLGPVLLLLSLNANAPRYLLSIFASAEMVGVYSAWACVAVAANTLVMALGQSSAPSIARHFQLRQTSHFVGRAATLFLLAAALASATVTIAWLHGDALIELAYGSAFKADTVAFRLVMVGAAIGYLAAAAGYVLSAVRCYAPQLPMFAVTLAVTCGVGWLVVPDHVLRGAAWAQIAGSSVQLAWSLVLLLLHCLPRLRSSE